MATTTQNISDQTGTTSTEPMQIAKSKKVPYKRTDQEAFAAKGGLEYTGPYELTDRFVDGKQIVNRRVISETYAFESPDFGKWNFDVRGVKDAIVSGKMQFQMFEAEMLGSAWYDHILSKGGVERPRIDELTGKDLRRPGILVIFTDQMQALIDGNHRLCARYERGARTFRYAGVSFAEVWRMKCVCRPGDEGVIFGPRHTDEGATFIGGQYRGMTADEFKKKFPNGIR